MRTRREDDLVTLESIKAKDAEPFQAMVFEAEPVVLDGLRDGDQQVTSLVMRFIRELDAPKAAPRQKLTHNQQLMLRAIRAGLKENGRLPPTDIVGKNGPVPGQLSLSRPHLGVAVQKLGNLTSGQDEDKERRYRNRVLQELQMRDLIGLSGEWIWLRDNRDNLRDN